MQTQIPSQNSNIKLSENVQMTSMGKLGWINDGGGREKKNRKIHFSM